ncbi:MAG: hypothetical protein AAFV43_11095 [Planctomycetota bacterium]
MNTSRTRHALNGFVCLVGLAIGGLCSASGGVLTAYYDPFTGAVALDTLTTRNGEALMYAFELDPLATDIRFNADNWVRLSGSTLFMQTELVISEGTLSPPLNGYYTIGEILPPGIDEATWQSLFARPNAEPGSLIYNDILGGGLGLPSEFIYGLPDRPFDNRWDVVDPDSLDWAAAATLVYDATSGELVLDTTGPDGGHIASFTLRSDDAFLADNYAPLPTPTSPINSATSGSVFVSADAIEPGAYSLGAILEAGLSQAEFEALFNEATFIARAGFGQASFDFATYGVSMSLEYVALVPEPSGVIVAIGAAALACIRRRTR